MNRRQFMKSVILALIIPLPRAKRFFTITVEMIYRNKGQYQIAGMAIEKNQLICIGSDSFIYQAIRDRRKEILRVMKKISSKQQTSFPVYYDK